MSKTIIKRVCIVVAISFISTATYFGYKKVEKNRTQTAASLTDMRVKLEGQKAAMNAQQSKIDELQGFKEEQQQANQQLSEQDKQNKKDDCDARLKKAQDSLATSQRYLGVEQPVLDAAKAGTCQDCYKACMKNNENRGDDAAFKRAQEQCKKNDEDNLQNRKSDVNGELASIKKFEDEIASIKNECNQ